MVLQTITLTQLYHLFGNKVKPILPKKIIIKNGYLTSPFEYKSLATLCRLNGPKHLFEIGTFEGYSTLILAMNSPNSTIYTLDLPLTNKKTKFKVGKDNERYIHKHGKIKFLGTVFEQRIKQLYGDSAVFDFAPFKEKCDFVFIDGAHTYEYTQNDTEKAMRIAKKNGVIVWHDYNHKYWPETVKFLNEFSQKHTLYHIKDTYLVFLIK